MSATSIGPAVVDATAWVALLLYPSVLIGTAPDVGPSSATWARRLFVLGAAVFLAHVTLAFAVHYEMSHAVALGDVARQTEELTGVGSGAGLYLNYLFALLWVVEAGWWSVSPRSYGSRPSAVTVTVQAFFLFMIVNGAVVFVDWPRRALGCVIVLICLAALGLRARRSGPVDGAA